MSRQGIAITVVLKPEWHKLTNGKHIEEVYNYYPSVYEDWVKKGLIPFEKRILTKTEQTEVFDF